MLKVLFVEDDPESVQPVILSLEEIGHECEVTDFAEAEKALERFLPDIVVLDLAMGSKEAYEIVGKETYDMIWQSTFRPIIVYSAYPEQIEGEKRCVQHPFVRVVQKGTTSVQKVKAAVDEFTWHVEALRESEAHVRAEFALVLRDVAPYAFEVSTDPGRRRDILLRSACRRLAALMDELSRDGQTLEAWEQYLFPPFSDSTRLGDILREADANPEDPSCFRLVLTPSCDMDVEGGRKPKVERVLVARCCSTGQGLALAGFKNMSEAKIRGRLRGPVLSQGYLARIVPLPALARKIPSMMADLRALELVPLGAIDVGERKAASEAEGRGVEAPKFIRVASLDSPFRELISWAYLQVACRPGLPTRDTDAWCEEIIDSLNADIEEADS